MYSAPPTTSDLTALLADAGMTAPSTVRLSAAVADAYEQWQRRTRWQPFLSDGSVSTRLYDPPGPRELGRTVLTWQGGGQLLELRQGLISLTSLTIDTTVWNVGTDFQLGPYGADDAGQPWTFINFGMPIFAGPQGIAITGQWGFGLGIPPDAWNGILYLAALDLIPVIAAKKSGGRAKVTRGESIDQYALAKDSGAYFSEAGYWEDKAAAAVKRYRRFRMGV